MSVRNIERAFNALHSQHNEEAALADPAQARVQQAQTEADRLRSLSTSMTTADVIERILLHYAERDYFRWEVEKIEALSILSDGGRGDAPFQSEVCWADVVECQPAHLVVRSHRLLELPAPEADVLGNVIWQGTALEVSKAYRRLSVLVHPDKNPGEDARKAFEALNEAHRVLKDADTRVGGAAPWIFERKHGLRWEVRMSILTKDAGRLPLWTMVRVQPDPCVTDSAAVSGLPAISNRMGESPFAHLSPNLLCSPLPPSGHAAEGAPGCSPRQAVGEGGAGDAGGAGGSQCRPGARSGGAEEAGGAWWAVASTMRVKAQCWVGNPCFDAGVPGTFSTCPHART